MNPERFVSDLRAISMDGTGSVALPDGLPKPSDREKPYQEYYDERYFIKDAPPPPKPSPAPSAHRGHMHDTHSHSDVEQRRPTAQHSYSSLSMPEEKEKEKKRNKAKKLFGF